MELIKKIKQAEQQATQIVEEAKANAAKQGEQGQGKRTESLAQAKQERKKAVDEATATARSQGLAEVEQHKAQAKTARQQLREKTAGRMATAVVKVVDYLKG